MAGQKIAINSQRYVMFLHISTVHVKCRANCIFHIFKTAYLLVNVTALWLLYVFSPRFIFRRIRRNPVLHIPALNRFHGDIEIGCPEFRHRFLRYGMLPRSVVSMDYLKFNKNIVSKQSSRYQVYWTNHSALVWSAESCINVYQGLSVSNCSRGKVTAPTVYVSILATSRKHVSVVSQCGAQLFHQ